MGILLFGNHSSFWRKSFHEIHGRNGIFSNHNKLKNEIKSSRATPYIFIVQYRNVKEFFLIFRTVDCAISSIRKTRCNSVRCRSQFEKDIEINEVQNWNLIGFSFTHQYCRSTDTPKHLLEKYANFSCHEHKFYVRTSKKNKKKI